MRGYIKPTTKMTVDEMSPIERLADSLALNDVLFFHKRKPVHVVRLVRSIARKKGIKIIEDYEYPASQEEAQLISMTYEEGFAAYSS